MVRNHFVIAAVATGAVIAGAITALPGASEARDKASNRCFPHGSAGLVRSRETRVYRLDDGRDRLVFACHYRTGRRRLLQSTEDGLYVYPSPAIGLRGELVGYAQEDQSDPVGPSLTSIAVMNVRTGRSAIKGSPLADPPNQNAKVGSLVVTSRASVAWIACRANAPSEGDPRSECVRAGAEARVYRLSAGATEPELLEQATTIDPRSLRLVGGTVKWMNGGASHRAPLR